MSWIKAHFDGHSIVLDEPASLEVGQKFHVIVGPVRHAIGAIINDDNWDERTALYIDPKHAVPADFVRRPGSGAGEIQTTEDFDETPEEFKDYL